LGDLYNDKYVVLRKLGWGHFSTVWMVYDRAKETTVALKVQKSAKHYTEAAKDEIEILQQLNSDPARAHHVVQLSDSFMHTGPNGAHMCMVFEMMGQNLLSLIKYFNYGGIPLDVVKVIARQLCQGLDYVHTSCSLIHTDLKPENVLMCLPPREVSEHFQTPLPRENTHRASAPHLTGRGARKRGSSRNCASSRRGRTQWPRPSAREPRSTCCTARRPTQRCDTPVYLGPPLAPRASSSRTEVSHGEAPPGPGSRGDIGGAAKPSPRGGGLGCPEVRAVGAGGLPGLSTLSQPL
jgi:serine/threonine protein kinase